MNASKNIFRLLILSQIFALFFLMLMPTLIKLLNDFWGKLLYTLMVLGSIGFALALRYALRSLTLNSEK